MGLFAVYFLLCGLLYEQHTQQEGDDDCHLQRHLVSMLGTGLFFFFWGGVRWLCRVGGTRSRADRYCQAGSHSIQIPLT
jgi:hypothetical protein